MTITAAQLAEIRDQLTTADQVDLDRHLLAVPAGAVTVDEVGLHRICEGLRDGDGLDDLAARTGLGRASLRRTLLSISDDDLARGAAAVGGTVERHR